MEAASNYSPLLSYYARTSRSRLTCRPRWEQLPSSSRWLCCAMVRHVDWSGAFAELVPVPVITRQILDRDGSAG